MGSFFLTHVHLQETLDGTESRGMSQVRGGAETCMHATGCRVPTLLACMCIQLQTRALVNIPGYVVSHVIVLPTDIFLLL